MAIRADPRTLRQPTTRARTLTDADVDALRLNWHTKIEPEDVRRILFSYPGRSVWLPETLEFAVVAPWRHRSEVANIRHLVAVRHPELLVEAAVERCDAHDAQLVISIELEDVRRPAFYRSVGFNLFEEVETYELDRLPPPGRRPGRLRFALVDPADARARATLLTIDHTAFPWLWQNNDLEFQMYSLTPGVELYLGFLEDQPVSYVGLTSYLGWGHLDRIAVLPALQGQGLGQEGLAFALDRLARLGSRRVGLSTQRTNVHSQHLYERAGFRRAWGNDYRVYGRFLRPVGEAPGGEGDDSGLHAQEPRSR
ncbi:MAG TPA: GNAT family N-acetyltransferase [Thermomicrobiales bacterium]|jgi:ribosomal protein S18 acetylase RimI-like enzyme